MHLILRYANGHRTDALALVMTTEMMRVVMRRSNETIEFRRISDRWVGDNGTRVSIDAIVSAALQPAANRGLTLAAG